MCHRTSILPRWAVWLSACALAILAAPAAATASSTAGSSKAKVPSCTAATPTLCPRLRVAVDRRIEAYFKKNRKKLTGTPGPAGPQGPAGMPGPATGPAGGALAGSYPNPTLNVTGGSATAARCNNGEAVTGFSVLAKLTCGFGVFVDTVGRNVGAGSGVFTKLHGGELNTAFGQSALRSVVDGLSNTAVGDSALRSVVDATENTAVGAGALFSNLHGLQNTAVGFDALQLNTGSGNSALGHFTLLFNTSGSNNSAFGQNALGGEHLNAANDNSAFGMNALAKNGPGVGNTAVGKGALGSNVDGDRNTALGFLAGSGLAGNGTSNIAIGNAGTATDNHVVRIGTPGSGTGQQNKAFLAGVRGVTTGVADAIPVLVDSAGQLGTASSSRRFKTGIRSIGPQLSELLRLRPVTFHYKQYAGHPGDRAQYGLIAEEVARVFPDLVVRGADGRPFTVMYQQLPPLLLGLAQRQQRQIDALRASNRRLRIREARIGSLERRLARLERALARAG